MKGPVLSIMTGFIIAGILVAYPSMNPIPVRKRGKFPITFFAGKSYQTVPDGTVQPSGPVSANALHLMAEDLTLSSTNYGPSWIQVHINPLNLGQRADTPGEVPPFFMMYRVCSSNDSACLQDGTWYRDFTFSSSPLANLPSGELTISAKVCVDDLSSVQADPAAALVNNCTPDAPCYCGASIHHSFTNTLDLSKIDTQLETAASELAKEREQLFKLAQGYHREAISYVNTCAADREAPQDAAWFQYAQNIANFTSSESAWIAASYGTELQKFIGLLRQSNHSSDFTRAENDKSILAIGSLTTLAGAIVMVDFGLKQNPTYNLQNVLELPSHFLKPASGMSQFFTKIGTLNYLTKEIHNSIAKMNKALIENNWEAFKLARETFERAHSHIKNAVNTRFGITETSQIAELPTEMTKTLETLKDFNREYFEFEQANSPKSWTVLTASEPVNTARFEMINLAEFKVINEAPNFNSLLPNLLQTNLGEIVTGLKGAHRQLGTVPNCGNFKGAIAYWEGQMSKVVQNIHTHEATLENRSSQALTGQ